MSSKDYALSTLGKNPRETAARDALHIPVIAARTNFMLHPGTPVTLHKHFIPGQPPIAQASLPGEAIGVVDPFLGRTADSGDVVWIFIKPSKLAATVTHHWEAPELDYARKITADSADSIDKPGNITSPEEERDDQDMCCPTEEEDMCCPGEGW